MSKKEKRIGVQERKLDSYILNIVIVNTKIFLYMKRSKLRIYAVLKFTYNEMRTDEYDSYITLQTERFSWEKIKKGVSFQ